MEDDRQPPSAVSWVLEHPTHKRNIDYILIKLAACIDAGNTCPSFNELAEMTGLTKPTIQHALGELEKDGTITITRHGGDTKRGGKKNCYALSGMTDPVKKPGKAVLPGQNDPVKPVVPGKDDPVKLNTPGQNAVVPAHTHVRAAGEIGPLDINTASTPKEKDKNTTTTLPVTNYQQHEPPVVAGSGGEVQIAFAPETRPTPPPPDKPLQELDNDLGKVAKCYEDNIGSLVEAMRVKLITALEVYPAVWITEAIDIAVEQNKRTWAYVNGILRRWKLEGKGAGLKAKLTASVTMMTEAEIQALTRAQNFDVPVFKPIGSTS